MLCLCKQLITTKGLAAFHLLQLSQILNEDFLGCLVSFEHSCIQKMPLYALFYPRVFFTDVDHQDEDVIEQTFMISLEHSAKFN